MEIQKSYSINNIELIVNFSKAKKGLFKLKFGIVCTQIKFWKELKIKIRIEKWILKMVETCLELKRIFGNNLGILVNFGAKIQRKIEENCRINFGENSKVYMVARGG